MTVMRIRSELVISGVVSWVRSSHNGDRSLVPGIQKLFTLVLEAKIKKD